MDRQIDNELKKKDIQTSKYIDRWIGWVDFVET